MFYHINKNIPLNKYSTYKEDSKIQKDNVQNQGFRILLELKIIKLTLRFERGMYFNIIRKKINKTIYVTCMQTTLQETRYAFT